MILPKQTRYDKQTTTSVRTPPTTLAKGLMKTKTCTTSVEMAKMMVPLISKQFTMTAEVTTELLVQLSAYFSHTGIHNKEFLAFMTNYVDWSPPHTFATPTQKMNLISIPVTLLLSKIASYTVALQEEKLYLSPGIGHCALFTWLATYNETSTENKDKTNQIVGATIKNKKVKISGFKVPIFRGDMLDGDEYIRMVKTTFRSNAMSQFLDSRRICDNSPYWSGAFASQLRDSIKESDILSFLATELDGENNCVKVWDRIERHLSSTDINMARIMTH